MLNFDEPVVKYLKYFENYKADRYLFRILNNPNNRPEKHAANKILRDENGEPYAVHCNCGWYHPIFYQRTKHFVLWSPEFIIKTKNSSLVKSEIKKLWVLEL
jgi:hypothetical protein